jgi:UDP:flavonoid glycosyltransferase YjiC (YdhE family)
MNRASKLGLAEIIPQRELTTERLLDAMKRLLDSSPDGLQRLPKQAPFSEAKAISAGEIEALVHDRPYTQNTETTTNAGFPRA